MFFGECCTNQSIFEAELWQSSCEGTNRFIVPLDKKRIIVKTETSIHASEIFDLTKNEIDQKGAWITFTPIEGKHSKHINFIYKNDTHNIIFDGVHSHSFTNKSTRTLKFAPFQYSYSSNINGIISIFGHKEKDTFARIRLLFFFFFFFFFFLYDSSLEIVQNINIKRNEFIL